MKKVRPLVDYEVDRTWVEVQQCMELNVTNRSRDYPKEEVCADEIVSNVFGFEGIMKDKAQWLSWLERRPVTAKVTSPSLVWVVKMGS